MSTQIPAVPMQHADPQPRRSFKQVLLSYFYWTYSRGSLHYDVMVTLILLFIFLTPHIPGLNYGDKPSTAAALVHPIQVVSDGECQCAGWRVGRGGEEGAAQGGRAGDGRCGVC